MKLPVGRRLAGAMASVADEENATDADRLRRGLRRGWFFSAIWLVYLYDPIKSVVQSDATTAHRVLALISLILFAVVYLSSFRDFRGRLFTESASRVSRQWLYLTILVVLLIPAAPLARSAILAGCIYISVMAVFTLPTRQAVIAVGASVLALAGLPRIIDGWEVDDTSIFSLLIASLAAWGVGQLIIRNIELQRARQRIADLAVVEERERLGRDVHDILGHTLTVITVKAELAGRLVDRDPERAAREIAEVEALARTALGDVRSTVGGLRRVTLDDELVHARTALDAAGVALTVVGTVSSVKEGLREVFAWTVREAVTNVVRHSAAESCRITIGSSSITVDDDGEGTAVDNDLSSNGLRGLAYRAERAGASFTAGACPSGGFRVNVSVAS